MTVKNAGRLHWLHSMGTRGRRLAAYAAAELSPAEMAHVQRVIAACPACRRDVEAYRRTAAVLRSAAQVHLSAAEAAAFLGEIDRRAGQGLAVAARRTRPGLREIVWDHPRLSLVSACAAGLLVIGVTLSQWSAWGPFGAKGVNGVEVVSVDVDENSSVMVYQAPGSSLKVIWVFDDTST